MNITRIFFLAPLVLPLLLLSGCSARPTMTEEVRMSITDVRVEACDYLPAMSMWPSVPMYGYSEGHWFDQGQTTECVYNRRSRSYECVLIMCEPSTVAPPGFSGPDATDYE